MDRKVLVRDTADEFYARDEMKRIQKVIGVFYNYIRDSRTCELLWTNKLGYTLLLLDPDTRMARAQPKVIRSAEELVRALLGELHAETKDHPGNGMGQIYEYMAQLPEYHKCMDELLTGRHPVRRSKTAGRHLKPGNARFLRNGAVNMFG